MVINFYKNKTSAVLLLASISFSCPAFNKTLSEPQTQNICFTENKGQVRDQDNKARPDILYGASDGYISYHLKNNGISYQITKVNSWKEYAPNPIGRSEKNINKKRPNQVDVYRLDINWVAANTAATIIKGRQLEGFMNYYSGTCPDGILNVKSFETITYENIYEGISLKWYEKNGLLKYDYLVDAGVDHKQIKLNIQGAEQISINQKGELVLKTALGDIVEQAPYVTQNGKKLKSAWQIIDNEISFKIDGRDLKQPLVIDPAIRVWGTYYGGSLTDGANWCTTDASNNVYIAGTTSSSGGTMIATSGSYQSNLIGSDNAFVAKFDASGVRQWATYFGGSTEYGISCAADTLGNVYLVGQTSSTTGIATIGSHQTVYGGGTEDGFLVKFDAGGIRQWSTYYGGFFSVNGSHDYVSSCATDLSGNVYIAGYTDSNTGTSIATPGSHQPSLAGFNVDPFVAKFNTNGVRLWGTYCGGTGVEYAYCTADRSGNVYLTGLTSSTAGIATPGSHQANPVTGNSPFDAYLVKFNTNGVRQWGTYYGGTEHDEAYACAVDTSGNIFMTGITTSNTLSDTIATLGSYQHIYGGGSYDAFLVKFNASGVRQWATYYGGPESDAAYSCSADLSGNVFIAGTTASSLVTAIATPGSYQFAIPAGAYLAKFSVNGARDWGTYYGGTSVDFSGATACSADASGAVYLAGYTDAAFGTAIATTGSHQDSFGGWSDAFLVKFKNCSAPDVPLAINGPTISCPGTAQYYVSAVAGATAYSWTLPAGWFGAGTTNTINALVGGSGMISVVASGTCGTSSAQTLNVTISPCTGINETDINDVSLMIYPNPNNGRFNLKFNAPKKENIYVEFYDVLGTLIYSADVDNDEINEVRLEAISNGVYFLKARLNDKDYVEKIAITK